MEMSIEDIRKEYRTAKDRKEQIKILAQLNETTPRTILEILHDAGEAVDMRWYSRPKPKRTAETPETPETPIPPTLDANPAKEEKDYMTSGQLIEILGRFPADTLVLDYVEPIKTVMFSVVFTQDGDERRTIVLNG